MSDIEGIYTSIDKAEQLMKASSGATADAVKIAGKADRRIYKLVSEVDGAASQASWGLSLNNMQEKYDEVMQYLQAGKTSGHEAIAMFTALAGKSNNPNARDVSIFGGMAALQMAGETPVGDLDVPVSAHEIGEGIVFIRKHMEAIRGIGSTVLEQFGLIHQALTIVAGAQEESRAAMKAYMGDIQ